MDTSIYLFYTIRLYRVTHVPHTHTHIYIYMYMIIYIYREREREAGGKAGGRGASKTGTQIMAI